MNIDIESGSRLERIIAKLISKAKLINDDEKGSVEIHYSGKSETITIRVVV